MTESGFDYTEVTKSDLSGEVTSIIAHQSRSGSPLRAVLWSVLHGAWVSAPATAAGVLYDDRNFERLRNVDRRTAEQHARDALHVDLPTEQELVSLALQGERMGWDYGPPR